MQHLPTQTNEPLDGLGASATSAKHASVLLRPYTEARYPSARPPAGMFPDNVRLAPSAHHALARATAKPSGTRGHWCGEHPSAERDGLAVVAAGGGQRGTLYDSFELNAMVLRLNRLLNGEGAGGSGEARRPRKAAGGGWLAAAPKVLFRKIRILAK